MTILTTQPADPPAMDPSVDVLVFGTTVPSRVEVETLAAALDRITAPHGSWTFDLEDRDRVLRIVARPGVADTVKALLNAAGYRCEDLGG